MSGKAAQPQYAEPREANVAAHAMQSNAPQTEATTVADNAGAEAMQQRHDSAEQRETPNVGSYAMQSRRGQSL